MESIAHKDIRPIALISGTLGHAQGLSLVNKPRMLSNTRNLSLKRGFDCGRICGTVDCIY